MPGGWKRKEASASKSYRRGGQGRNHPSSSYHEDSYYTRERWQQWDAVNCSRGAVRSAASHYVESTPHLERSWSDLSDDTVVDTDELPYSSRVAGFSLDAFLAVPAPEHRFARPPRIEQTQTKPQKIMVDASEQPRHSLPQTVEFAITFLRKGGHTQWNGAAGNFAEMHWHLDELIMRSVLLVNQLCMTRSCMRFAEIFRDRFRPALLQQYLRHQAPAESEFDYSLPALRHYCDDCGGLMRAYGASGMYCTGCFCCTRRRCRDLNKLHCNARLSHFSSSPHRLNRVFVPYAPVWSNSSVNYYKQTSVCPLCDRCRACNSTAEVAAYGWKEAAAYGRPVQYFDILCAACAGSVWKVPTHFQLKDKEFDHMVSQGVRHQEQQLKCKSMSWREGYAHRNRHPVLEVHWEDATRFDQGT